MHYNSTKNHNPDNHTVSSFLYGLFIYFTIDFFIHFSARIPGYGVLRPTFLLTLLIAIMLYSQREKFKGYSNTPAFKAIIWLIMFVILSIPFVTWPGSVLKQNLPDFIKAVSFFFFAALILDTDKRLKTFLMVFLSCQTIRVLEPLYLHITTGYWGSLTYIGGGEFAGRLSGAPADVINANGLGFVIVTLVPFLYYLLWRSKNKVGKLLCLVLLPTLVYALVLTMSRGALLALCVVGWMIFKESKNKITLIAVVLAGAAVMWSNMSALQKARYLSLIESDTGQSGTVEGRIDGMWKEFSLGLRRPIFGHGVGTTPEAKTHVLGKSRASHNLYAELLIEIGVIGFIIFMKYLISIYRSLKHNNNIMLSLGEELRGNFAYRLNQALVAVFWMYVVFSMAYWGLSVYYWYLFGGLSVAFSRIYFNKDMASDKVAVYTGDRATA